MKDYNAPAVRRLLTRYLATRALIDGQATRLENIFIGGSCTKAPIDGKRQARAKEELHCALLDIEKAMSQMPIEDRIVITRYFIFGETLENLKHDYKLQTRGGMQRKIERSVQRLVFELNHLYR